MTNKPTQLALGIELSDDMTLANYYAGDNQVALTFIDQLCDPDATSAERLIYLWGNNGVGCSHLLQAACLQFQLTGRNAIYLPLEELICYTPEILENLEYYDLVCLDNIEVIVGNKIWQEALFHLFNRLRDDNKGLLIAANVSPYNLAIELADLKSRLSLALVFQLHPLSDDEKIKALQLRASCKGIELSDEVASFILARSNRDMGNLLALLGQLDKASLVAKHKLTIPFVKQVFNW
ncbi:DnaA regulatory inactivator Hda [Gammaproteobacteria bacterium ESL0073]|nr:DnaA regulatory inactivator Hda [Gammaproteobacteria bacterium ESL0073]